MGVRAHARLVSVNTKHCNGSIMSFRLCATQLETAKERREAAEEYDSDQDMDMDMDMDDAEGVSAH